MRHPIRAVHQIEITSRCNLRCAYCPSYRLPRPKVDMTRETFNKALAWAAKLERIYHHGELNLAGIGESTLHPSFEEFVWAARRALPDVRLVLATNGLLVDDGLAKRIAGTGIHVYVSLHRPEKAQGAIAALSKYGILKGMSCDPAIASTNWAGQMKWPVTTPAAGQDCTWVKEGKVIVMADGRVSRCSFDADGCGVIATVDDDLFKFGTSPYKLCAGCHLKQVCAAEEAA